MELAAKLNITGGSVDVEARESRMDLSTTEGIEKMSKRIRIAFDRLAKGSGDADDCVQEILCRMWEGKHQHSTINQCVIDYLRTKSGRKGSAGYTARFNLEYADSLEPRGDESAPWLDHGRKLHTGMLTGDADESSEIDRENLAKWLSRDERVIFLLRTKWGMSEAEIGNIFGITESGVCFRLKGIQKRLSERIKKEESKTSGKGKGQVEGILRAEEAGDWWRLESFEDRGVEKIESW